jgi:hypothetical protein
MRRRPKTKEELRTDLKTFEAAWRRELAQVMRNAAERMVIAGSGRRIPAKYKMKLPRLTRTVPISFQHVAANMIGRHDQRIRHG